MQIIDETSYDRRERVSPRDREEHRDISRRDDPARREDADRLGPGILEMAGQMLEICGYSPLLAVSGVEAHQIVDEFEGEIHMLLADVILPVTNGWVLADELIEKRPDMKLLFTSSYTEGVTVHHGVLKSAVTFVPKPYALPDMLEAIRKVLES